MSVTPNLAEDYGIILEAIRDAEALAAAGSVTATAELPGLYSARDEQERRSAEAVRGPSPVVTVTETPDTRTVMLIHQDLLVLLDGSDFDARRGALGRVLPYMARGDDLAFLLGYQA